MIAPFRFLIAIALALATGAAANAQPRLSAADIEAPAYTIVKIKANGVDPKAALEWEVTPEKFVDFATSEDETLLQFVAPPGDYIVNLRVISQDPVTGKLSSKKLKATVKILPPEGEQIPPPKPPGKPPEKGQGRLDAPAAIGKISFPPYSVLGPAGGDRGLARGVRCGQAGEPRRGPHHWREGFKRPVADEAQRVVGGLRRRDFPKGHQRTDLLRLLHVRRSNERPVRERVGRVGGGRQRGPSEENTSPADRGRGAGVEAVQHERGRSACTDAHKDQGMILWSNADWTPRHNS
jgi:hypothetical protein